MRKLSIVIISILFAVSCGYKEGVNLSLPTLTFGQSANSLISLSYRISQTAISSVASSTKGGDVGSSELAQLWSGKLFGHPFSAGEKITGRQWLLETFQHKSSFINNTVSILKDLCIAMTALPGSSYSLIQAGIYKLDNNLKPSSECKVRPEDYVGKIFDISLIEDSDLFDLRINIFKKGALYKVFYLNHNLSHVAVRVDHLSDNRRDRITRIFLNWDEKSNRQDIEWISHDYQEKSDRDYKIFRFTSNLDSKDISGFGYIGSRSGDQYGLFTIAGQREGAYALSLAGQYELVLPTLSPSTGCLDQTLQVQREGKECVVGTSPDYNLSMRAVDSLREDGNLIGRNYYNLDEQVLINFNSWRELLRY
jgi:hypothetical protein